MRSPKKWRRCIALVAMSAGLAFAIAGCTTSRSASRIDADPTSGPSARGYVQSEILSLPASGSFEFQVEGFESAWQETGSSVTSPLLTARPGDRTNVQDVVLLGSTDDGSEGPASQVAFGSDATLLIAGNAMITLEQRSTILGMFVSLTRVGLWEHRGLPAHSSMSITFTGRRNGKLVSGVRVRPAFASGGAAEVESEWQWVDLTLLGEVDEIIVQVKTPLAAEPEAPRSRWASRRARKEAVSQAAVYGVLIDNVTVSTDFAATDEYFTMVVLPELATGLPDSLAVVEQQVDFVKRPETGDSVVFTSFIGDSSSLMDDDDEAPWFVPEGLIGMPFGYAIGVNDFAEEWDDVDDAAPDYVEAFGEDFADDNRYWTEVSKSQLSNAQIIDTPVGPLVVINLPPGTPAEELEWAEDALNDNRDKPTIIVTQRYLDLDRRSREAIVPRGGTEEVWPAIPAEQLFRSLVYEHGQIFLVLSADGPVEYAQWARNKVADPVIEIRQGYTGRQDGGEGFLRILRFYPDRNELRALTYSPVLGLYEHDSNSSLIIPMDFTRLGDRR